MDPTERYNLCLTGEIGPEKRLENVTRAVARLYQVDEQKIAMLFSTAPRVLKSNLDYAKARKYQRALTRAGAVVYLEPVVDGDDSSGSSPSDLAGPVAPTLSAKPSRSASRALPVAGITAVIGIGLGTMLGLFIAESGLVSPEGGKIDEGVRQAAIEPAIEPELAAMDARVSQQAPEAEPQPEPESKPEPEPVPVPVPSSVSNALSAVTEPGDIADGPAASDGPFGLRMGLNLAELEAVLSDSDNGTIQLERVPAPRSDFVEFHARLGPQSGLCWFKALGAPLSTTADGVALREAFERVEAELDGRHGAHRRTALLLPSSALADPNLWMQSLAQNERYLFSLWSRATGAEPADDLARVVLRASAQSEDAGRISIEYGFSNEAQCDAEIAALHSGRSS